MFKIPYVILATLLFALIPLDTFGKGGSGVDPVYVHGYTKKDGTYVAPYMRTAPSSSKADNWSTQGNINPYTGKEGTKRIDSSDTADITLSPTPVASTSPSSSPIGNSPPASKGTIYFSRYENLTREQLLAKVTELETKNAQLERRLASQLAPQTVH